MAEELDVGMPQGLLVQQGYTLRITAVDANGAVVPGVKVSTTVFTADDGTESTPTGPPPPTTLDQWFLVPGPNA